MRRSSHRCARGPRSLLAGCGGEDGRRVGSQLGIRRGPRLRRPAPRRSTSARARPVRRRRIGRPSGSRRGCATPGLEIGRDPVAVARTWSARSRVLSRGTVVVGAHYDTKDAIPGFVGANDGASGVAVLLELARTLPAAAVRPRGAARRLRRRGGARRPRLRRRRHPRQPPVRRRRAPRRAPGRGAAGARSARWSCSTWSATATCRSRCEADSDPGLYGLFADAAPSAPARSGAVRAAARSRSATTTSLPGGRRPRRRPDRLRLRPRAEPRRVLAHARGHGRQGLPREPRRGRRGGAGGDPEDPLTADDHWPRGSTSPATRHAPWNARTVVRIVERRMCRACSELIRHSRLANALDRRAQRSLGSDTALF